MLEGLGSCGGDSHWLRTNLHSYTSAPSGAELEKEVYSSTMVEFGPQGLLASIPLPAHVINHVNRNESVKNYGVMLYV